MTLLCKVREQESLCRGLRRPDLVSFSLRGSEFISNDNEGPKIGPKFRASIMLYLGVMFGTRRDKFAQWTSGSEMVTARPYFLWARDPYLRIFVIIPYHPDLLGGP